MMKARLFSPFGPLAGFDLTTETAVTLGSGRDNTVVVPGRTISNRHARLSPEAGSGEWLLEDLGSTNGTELDGMRVVGAERLTGLHVIDLSGAVTFFFLPLVEGEPVANVPKSNLRVDVPEPRVPSARLPPPSPAPSVEPRRPELARATSSPAAPPAVVRREIHLEVRARGQLLRRYTLKEGRNLVGRSVLADVRLERDDISREHAMVAVAEGVITVEDLGSTNGTFVDGREADKPIAVDEGSDIRFGGVHAKVMVALLE